MTRLLDISRLVRRAGRRLTGIDRVELAYLTHLVDRPEPFFALARTPLGYILLDEDGARRAARAFATDHFPPLDVLGHLAPRRPKSVRQAEALLRKHAVGRCVPHRLPAMLLAHLPQGVRYINTGHSNLTARVLAALKAVRAQVAVLIHDVIPLQAPQWQRPTTAETFAQFLQRADAAADLLIFNSAASQRAAGAYLTGAADQVVAHLGVDIAEAGNLPSGVRPKAPYFVSVSTIEPRKNHGFLLDLWERMGPDAPELYLVGGRGWNNDAVFARLDAGIAGVHELSGLGDDAVTTLLAGAAGALFPSHLEGFGLPPMEAAALGVPVVCQPLDALREVMGDIPIYAKTSDPYQWKQIIKDLKEQQRRMPAFAPPTWTDHFNIVLRST